MKKEGFTLIELVVTLAIIGLLVTVVVVGIDAAKKASRDAKRVAQISQLGKALTLYFSENDIYPISTSKICIDGNDPVTTALLGAKVLTQPVSDPFFQENSKCYRYQSDAEGLKYSLEYFLERSSDSGVKGNNKVESD